MPPSAQSHGRSHALLLLQKLLNLRDGASPLTLVLDTLEQSAGAVVREFLARAKAADSKIIFVSYATLKPPGEVHVLVKARGKSPEALRSEIVSHYAAGSRSVNQSVLLVVDALNALASAAPSQLSQFLSSLITPAVSLIGVYHTDVPLVLARCLNEYEPHPLTVLLHLATAVLRVSSLYQAIARKQAQHRSLQEPEWGLREDREGVLIGLRPKELSLDSSGLVIEMEIRRRSGRSIGDKFVLEPGSDGPSQTLSRKILLLAEHPAHLGLSNANMMSGPGEGVVEATFNLGLTDKQRQDRDGVVLPYFDAQTDIGAGEGGRILYEMGREDDFDEEEDEL